MDKFLNGLRWFKNLLKFLSPIMASIFSIFILYFFFKINEQGEDVLRTLVESKFSDMWLQTLLFFTILFLFALNVWYFARVMLNFKFDTLNYNSFAFEDSLRKYLPRILGVSSFLIIILSLKDINGSFLFIVITTILMIIFYIIVYKRVEIISKYLYNNIRISNVYNQKLKSLSYLSKANWIVICINFAIDITLGLIFIIWLDISTKFGSAAIILSAITLWVGIGATLIYFGLRTTFPIFTLLFIFAIAFSNLNNNHKIVSLKSTHFKDRPSLQEAFNNKFKDIKSEKKEPFFIITADGGGIRAAYWSAMVLSALTNYNSNFSKRIFAISAVSGGSLGVTIYKTLLNDNAVCKGSKENQDFGVLGVCSDLILKQDYLSYPTAYLLYSDLIQRFLPFPIDKADRGKALEEGVELGYKKVTNKNSLSKNFLNLYNNKKLPYLFLNSTWVEGGQRIIMSEIALNNDFPYAIDFFKIFKQDSKVSAMIHNSARFSYVSPAGDIVVNQKSWGHIVDGGYFENSGATTAIDILNGIKDIKSKNLIPVVITLTNDPSLKEKKEIKSQNFMNEVLSPIRALLNSRSARGESAKKELQSITKLNKGIFIEFAICPSKNQPPLGWSLSNNSRLNMINQLKEYFKEFKTFDPLNIKDLKKLEELNLCIKK